MRIRQVLLLLICCSFLSGCFELVEEIDLHADGTGTFVFEMNMSQSKTKLSALMALDTAYGMKVPSQNTLNQEMDKAGKTLSASAGIGKVIWKRDFENFIFSLRFDFKSIEDLNKALANLNKSYSKSTKTTATVENGYRYEGKTFERLNKFDAKKEMEKVPKKDMDLFKDAFITCIYKFDQPIKQFTNADAKLSKNGKAILLKISLTDLLNGSKNISNKIQLN
jgi:hypothetical protein